ncbi:MAG: DUF3261 domain-containing protein [Polyangiaceae bacterium]|nr:DUF3261 domain-containing protein [Polyangiaceae bacterium]
MRPSWLLALSLLCACGPAPRATRPALSPASFADLAQVDWDFSWRQSIVATYVRPDHGGRTESASFEAVLQKEGSILTLVGLTPFGSRAFVIRQVGVAVSVIEGRRADLPFEASYILLDVNRCFFLGLTSKTLADGWTQQEVNGEVIRDFWQGGQLKERIFLTKGEPTGSRVLIRYTPGFTRSTAPKSLELVNERFRYRLNITLLEAEPPL